MVDVRADAFAHAAASVEQRHGAGVAFAIVGDAGIGKSTLVGRITEHARSAGVPVVATRWSGDDATPPMWSWSVLFRNWASTLGPLSALEEVHPLVRRLAPEVVEAARMSVPDAPADELSSRYLIGDALGRLVARADSRVLVVLEDLHHAPPGGLGLLSSFATAALNGPVVIVATSRSGADVRDLTTLPMTTRFDLEPLAPTAAATLVRAVNGSLDDEGVQAVVDRADGNPFFLAELARLSALTDAAATTTPAVRDVVLQRVNGLGADAREVLSVAALLGRKAERAVVAAVIGDDERADRVFDSAEDARLVEGDGAMLRFSHDLVRDALVESLRSLEAQRLHARIAAALRDVSYVSQFQLAHHLLESGATTGEAADAGESAAIGAADAGALEEVVRWADRTLIAASRLPDRAERMRRLDLLAGRALVGLSAFVEGKERLVRSAEAAIAASDGRGAAEALLSIGAERLRNNEVFVPPRDLLAQALALVEDEPRWRCRLIGRSSDLEKGDRARELAEEALTVARASGDPDLIVTALGRVLVDWRDNSRAERQAIVEELARIGPQASPERTFEAIACRVVVLLENGELDEAARLVPIVNAAVLRLGLPVNIAFDWTSALIATLQGRFDEGDEIMMGLARRATSPLHLTEVMGAHAVQRGIVACLRGDFGDIAEVARTYLQMAAGTPAESRVLAQVAFIAAHTGDFDEARNAVDRVFTMGLDGLRDGASFGIGDVMLMALTEALCLLGDQARAAHMEPVVRKWEGRMAVGGMGPAMAFGSADHLLALTARLRGDLRAARDYADAAIAFHRRMRSQPLEARSLLVAAEVALAQDDADAAAVHARAAAKLALRFGMVPTREAAARVLAAVGAAPVRGVTVGGLPMALVFTDIESSTQSAAVLGDDAWMERLRDHDRTVRKLAAQHNGREVKHLGDGFMLTFPTATDAVAFARALQSAFRNGLVRVRAGIHVGPVVEEDGDVFGTTVNVAARVSAAAAGGETLVSEDVLALAPTKTGESRAVTLKGVDQPIRLYPLA